MRSKRKKIIGILAAWATSIAVAYLAGILYAFLLERRYPAHFASNLWADNAGNLDHFFLSPTLWQLLQQLLQRLQLSLLLGLYTFFPQVENFYIVGLFFCWHYHWLLCVGSFKRYPNISWLFFVNR